MRRWTSRDAIAASGWRLGALLGALGVAACGSPAPQEQTRRSASALSGPADAGAASAADAGAVTAVALTPAEAARVTSYREAFYATADIQHSFLTALGEPIDCIDFYAQPSVKWFLSHGVAKSALDSVPAPAIDPVVRQRRGDGSSALRRQPGFER